MIAEILSAKSGGLTQKPCGMGFYNSFVNPLHNTNNEARSAATLTGLLTTNQPESIEVAMQNDITHKNILPFAVCNAYVQCTAWRTSIVVFYHFSAISRMCHATHNGAVYCLPSGVSLLLLVRVTVIFRANNTSRHPGMVTLVGLPKGRPVSVYAGIPTPVNVTAHVEIGTSGGDSLNLYKGAADMATPPARARSEFTWRFWSCQQSRYITSTAASEREARAQLPDAPCLFAARLPVQEVHNHA